jgi:hypothetical protein
LPPSEIKLDLDVDLLKLKNPHLSDSELKNLQEDYEKEQIQLQRLVKSVGLDSIFGEMVEIIKDLPDGMEIE